MLKYGCNLFHEETLKIGKHFPVKVFQSFSLFFADALLTKLRLAFFLKERKKCCFVQVMVVELGGDAQEVVEVMHRCEEMRNQL